MPRAEFVVLCGQRIGRPMALRLRGEGGCSIPERSRSRIKDCRLWIHCWNDRRRFSKWKNVRDDFFQGLTARLLRQDEISSPQETWVRVFPCGCEFSTCTSPTRWNLVATKKVGCEFSHVGASFPMWVRVFNLHFSDKMKSRRHKRRGCTFSHVGARFPTCTLPEPRISHRFC